jgi:hypothetical protein
MMVEAKKGVNQGDDIAGIIKRSAPMCLNSRYAIPPNATAARSYLTSLKPGDRVAAFHEMCTPGRFLCGAIPRSISSRSSKITKN